MGCLREKNVKRVAKNPSNRDNCLLETKSLFSQRKCCWTSVTNFNKDSKNENNTTVPLRSTGNRLRKGQQGWPSEDSFGPQGTNFAEVVVKTSQQEAFHFQKVFIYADELAKEWNQLRGQTELTYLWILTVKLPGFKGTQTIEPYLKKKQYIKW